tara:strand:+ start:532 stop:996 length:465 start_codon:yes stop_codon:yes gene_type:complete
MNDIKQKIYKAITGKQFAVILVVTAIFIAIAVYSYKKFIKTKVNPTYVDNKEFINDGLSDKSDADLYFFYTEWCPYCKTAMPVWDRFEKKIGKKRVKDRKINFIKVDCGKEKDLADKYDIKGYPTIKMVVDDKVIEYDAKTEIDTLHQFLNSSL